MSRMTVQEIFNAIDRGLAEVSRRAAAGELDGSGRFYTDEELAAGAATGKAPEPVKKAQHPAA